MIRNVKSANVNNPPLDQSMIQIKEALFRVLRLPAVAERKHLITISDCPVTGMVARDQMVGPW